MLIGQNHFCRSAWPMMPTPVGAGYSSSWLGPNDHEAYERLTQVATSAEVSLGEFLERAVFLEHEPYERLTHMAAQARASEAQFLEHLILRAEAIYNLQPPVLPPPRPCRPSWATCVTLLDHLGILVGLTTWAF